MTSDSNLPLPAPIFTQHLRPLDERLTDESAVSAAQVVALDLTATDDPRVAEYHAIHGVGLLYESGPMVMLAWPDDSVGPAWMSPGRSVVDCVAQAYLRARECLEAIHLRSAPAANGHH